MGTSNQFGGSIEIVFYPLASREDWHYLDFTRNVVLNPEFKILEGLNPEFRNTKSILNIHKS